MQIRPVVVTPEEFRIAYPKVQAWIQKTLAAYEKDAQPIASMHFARLPLYFDYDLLETVKFHTYRSSTHATPISDGARPVCSL